MFIVFKNGVRFLETPDYGEACAAARKDAIRCRLSSYSVWQKTVADRVVRSSQDKPLYQISAGVTYTTPTSP